MSDKDKETFEKAIREIMPTAPLGRLCSGYVDATVDGAYTGWQAALTHAAQKDAEIERLKRVIFLMGNKLEAHGEKFNTAEFDAALSVAQQEG